MALRCWFKHEALGAEMAQEPLQFRLIREREARWREVSAAEVARIDRVFGEDHRPVVEIDPIQQPGEFLAAQYGKLNVYELALIGLRFAGAVEHGVLPGAPWAYELPGVYELCSNALSARARAVQAMNEKVRSKAPDP